MQPVIAHVIEDLSQDEELKLKKLSLRIQDAWKTAKDGDLELGKVIAEAHKLLARKGRAGQFRSWIESNGIPSSTAYEHKYVYERSQQFPDIVKFPGTVRSILASPGVPEAALKEAFDWLQRSEELDVKSTKKIISRHTSKDSLEKASGEPEASLQSQGEENGPWSEQKPVSSTESSPGEGTSGSSREQAVSPARLSATSRTVRSGVETPVPARLPSEAPPETYKPELFEKAREYLVKAAKLIDHISNSRGEKTHSRSSHHQSCLEKIDAANEALREWELSCK